MATKTKETVTGFTLPDFLQKTEKYPAFIFNNKGKIIACNNLFKKLSGVANNKALYAKIVFTAQGFAAITQAVQQLLSKPMAVAEAAIGNHQISWEILPDKDAAGVFLSVGAITFTLPDANIPLDDSQYSAFMNNSPALMWATDKQHRLVIINKKFKEVTGFSDDDVGKTLWQLFSAEMAAQYIKNDRLVELGGGLMEIEETSTDKFGRKRDYLVYKFPLQTTDHGLVVAGWSVDITEHKNANKQLLHQNNRLRQIARLQSHAVRRPLANILGLIDLVIYYSEEHDYAEIGKLIKLLKQSSNDLDTIIKKIVNKAGVFQPHIHSGL